VFSTYFYVYLLNFRQKKYYVCVRYVFELKLIQNVSFFVFFTKTVIHNISSWNFSFLYIFKSLFEKLKKILKKFRNSILSNFWAFGHFCKNFLSANRLRSNNFLIFIISNRYELIKKIDTRRLIYISSEIADKKNFKNWNFIFGPWGFYRQWHLSLFFTCLKIFLKKL